MALSDSQISAQAERLAGSIAQAGFIVVLSPDSLEVHPRTSLPYPPAVPPPPEPPASVFVPGEESEFKGRDLPKAIQAYRTLTKPNIPAVQAGALLRLGRTLRKAG